MNELDRVLDEFDSKWHGARSPPALGTFLEQSGIPADQRTEALAELIAIDMEYRWRRTRPELSAEAEEFNAVTGDAPSPGSPFADRPVVEDYAERWPEILQIDSLRLHLIVEEFRVRHRWGDCPDRIAYQVRFGPAPQLDEALAAVECELRQDEELKTAPLACSADRSAPCVETPGDEVPYALRKLSRYRILRRLGRGGMGEVYLAEDTQLGRKVALKTPRFAGDAVLYQRFINEAKATAALQHPSICPIFDAGEIDGQPFLTMAFIHGPTLREHWTRSSDQTLDQTLFTFAAIARAMQVAHEAGIVHRDLKPSNVMIDDGFVPVVMDFGLARRQDIPDCERLTQAGDTFGSPGYMSPEQIEGPATDVRPASDIYSLGTMLFEALTGRLPFSGSASSILVKTARDEPPLPSQWGHDIDPEVDELCTQMLAKDPRLRPSSMREVAERLTAIRQRLLHEQREPVGSRSLLKSEWCPGYRMACIAAWILLAAVTIQAPPSLDLVSTVEGREDLIPTVSETRLLPEPSSAASMQPKLGTASECALRFDGIDDHVVTPVFYDGSHPITVEAWVAPADPYGKGAVFSNASDSGFYIHQDYDERTRSRSWSARVANLGRWVTTVSHADSFPHQRTHVAAVWNGTVLQIYVGGKRRTTGVTPLGAIPFSDLPLLVGTKHPRVAESEFSSARFQGEIDEVRVSTIARYETDFEPLPHFRTDAHTLALYHFDEGQGDIAVDSSGRENHARVVGATWVAAASMDEPSPFARQVEQFVAEIARPLPPRSGPALRFAHTDDCATLPPLDLDFTQPFAIEVWLTPEPNHQTSDWKRVITQVGPLSLSIQNYHDMYAFQTWLDGRGANVNSVWPDTVHYDRRTHLAAQFNGRALELFVNGRRSPGLLSYRNLSSTEAEETIRTIMKSATGQPLVLGRRIKEKSTLGGLIDRFRLSRGVRYAGEFEPEDFQADERTVVLYDFHEGAGEILHDRSGNGHHGQIEGATWVMPTASTKK